MRLSQLFVSATLLSGLLALAGCPGTPKVPSGPPPEYEDPPPPSWLDAGSPTPVESDPSPQPGV